MGLSRAVSLYRRVVVSPCGCVAVSPCRRVGAEQPWPPAAWPWNAGWAIVCSPPALGTRLPPRPLQPPQALQPPATAASAHVPSSSARLPTNHSPATPSHVGPPSTSRHRPHACPGAVPRAISLSTACSCIAARHNSTLFCPRPSMVAVDR